MFDQIEAENKKKDYPKPGPGNYWHDKVTLKKVAEEVRDIHVIPEIKVKQKNNLPKVSTR
jgi:hypothetical protein